ncbi:hypothetical protein PCE1_004283 [Barthelona sp. PCE]
MLAIDETQYFDFLGEEHKQEEEMEIRPTFEWEEENVDQWVSLKEDENGLVVVQEDQEETKEEAIAEEESLQPLYIKNTVMVIDLTHITQFRDFLPDRKTVLLKAAQEFANSYMENPLSNLNLIVVHPNAAEIKDLTVQNIAENKELHKLKAVGIPSLACDIDNAIYNLFRCGLPSTVSKEVVVFFGNYGSFDTEYSLPDLVTKLQTDLDVRVSVLGLGAHVHILERLCFASGGTYKVAIDSEDAYTKARELAKERMNSWPTLIKIGFTQKKIISIDGKRNVHKILDLCPRCSNILESLPCSCGVCRLLVTNNVSFPQKRIKKIVKLNQVLSVAKEPGFCTGCHCELEDDTDNFCALCAEWLKR